MERVSSSAFLCSRVCARTRGSGACSRRAVRHDRATARRPPTRDETGGTDGPCKEEGESKTSQWQEGGPAQGDTEECSPPGRVTKEGRWKEGSEKEGSEEERAPQEHRCPVRWRKTTP